MHWYKQHIFPRLMDWSMRQPAFQRLRRLALAPVYGEVLEVGFGTGLNLPHYPPAVTSLTTVDPMAALQHRVARRITASGIQVTRLLSPAETLPLDEDRFDWVVTTWTLCTIADPVTALQEMSRVLKPNGQYVFLEHGRSDDTRVARWQDALNPLQKRLACGCNLNRPIDQLIQQAGLEITTLERFYMPSIPRPFGAMYRGTALPVRTT
jgi:ubiquinone/menaquinone biosynthesis C-methylase UbiE